MTKEEMIKKIYKFAIAILILTIINTVLLLIAVGEKGDSTSSSSSSTSETSEYDVSMFEEISSSDFIKLFSDTNSGTNVIYLGRESCSYCVAFLPSIQQAQSELGFTTKYLDITTVSEDDATTISGLNDFLSENYGSTPLVIVTKDGKYVDGWVGYGEYSDYVSFLNNAGIK